MTTLESMDPRDLRPYPDNAKLHPQDQVDRLAKQIAAHGFDVPIVVDKDLCIIKGHGRTMAALQLGLKTVPVIVRTDLSPEQVRAARLADNKLAESAWDQPLFARELVDLQDLGFDLMLAGLTQAEIDALLPKDDDPVSEPKETDPDVVPDVAPARTQRGQVWKLGRHRLMCGDSTSEDVATLMGGERAALVHTDPPYNVDYSNADRPHAGKKDLGRIKNDAMGDDDFQSFLHAVYLNIDAHTQDDCAVYVWYADRSTVPIYTALEGTGLTFAQMLIWRKPMLLGRSRYQWAYEPCLFAVKGSPYHTEDRTKTTVWDFGGYDKSKNVHPTQKPVVVPEEAIKNSSRTGDIVLDLFGGSGSTLIACENTGRKARLMELDPKYCDVILKRWEDFTGKKAQLVLDVQNLIESEDE